MTRVVIRCPIASTKIVGILWENRTAECKLLPSSVGHLVQRMAKGIVGLKHPTTPPRKPLFEGSDHAIVVGNGASLMLHNTAKSRIRAGRNGWAAAHRFGEGSEPKCICVWIIKKFMDTVISKIANGHGTRRTETLLCLHTPFLILG